MTDPNKCEENIETQHYIGSAEPSYSFNIWEVFMFPYTMFAKVCAPFLAVCNNQNACLLYWIGVQMMAAKVEQLTTCNALFYPYYFYVFGQCAGLTLLFLIIFLCYGDDIIFPFFKEFWKGFTQGPANGSVKNPYLRPVNSLRMRKYCFKKSDLLKASSAVSVTPTYVIVDLLVLLYNLSIIFVDYILPEITP